MLQNDNDGQFVPKEIKHTRMEAIRTLVSAIYAGDADRIVEQIQDLLMKYACRKTAQERWVNEQDVMVITYGDTIVSENETGIQSLSDLFGTYIRDAVSAIHLLPFFTYSSDDGFSVIDYKKPRREVGTWDEIKNLASRYDLMIDAVINHISSQSEWFRCYKNGEAKYCKYFIECDPAADYSQVTRPRTLPLLTEVETIQGKKCVWTTFSADQIDLNYANPDVLIDILDVLLFYVAQGARYLRLDAIGFMWKELGTSCMHHPKTHLLIKLMRKVIEQVNSNVVIITETNTPHAENISYFGDNYDEAQMVYQFPLPPLVAHAFLTGNSIALLNWYKTLDPIEQKATYFNFLASHDGIGLRPAEGILDSGDIQTMADAAVRKGGRVSYRNMPDGSRKPYELNISYLSLLCEDEDPVDVKASKFMASQAILLSVVGMPGIYIHSLLGSENDIDGMVASGINRRINRAKLDKAALFGELNDQSTLRANVLNRYLDLLRIRKTCRAFSPEAKQTCDFMDRRVFSITRHHADTGETVRVRINLSAEPVPLHEEGTDLITGKGIGKADMLHPYEILWLQYYWSKG